MPVQYDNENGLIKVVVEPDFRGDVVSLAKVRVVWIVDTEGNKPQINRASEASIDATLHDVSRVPVEDPYDRESNLLEILGNLDDHYFPYPGIIVHGLDPDAKLVQTLEEEGFKINETTPDGFTASLDVRVRAKSIGRDVAQ